MNILTIDLEEWFHVVFEGDPADWKNKESRVIKNTEFVLDELINNNIKATFFAVGWIARQYPDLVKKINNAGFEIGSHSDSHRVVYKFSKSGFNADVKRSVESLEALIGKKVTSFRAPYFSLTNSVDDYLDTLVENGIEIDSSICPIVTKYGGYKNFPSNEPCLIKSKNCTIKEFPLSTYTIFNKQILYSGGGYFRLFPFVLIKSLFKRQEYNMTYFHPHDFDGEQPALNLSFIQDLRRKIGSASAGDKFKKLLASFDFLDIGASDKLINWNKVSVVNFEG